MKLYIATFENAKMQTDVVWFVAKEGKQLEEAIKTVREWEAMEDDIQVTIWQIYQVGDDLIAQVKGSHE